MNKMEFQESKNAKWDFWLKGEVQKLGPFPKDLCRGVTTLTLNYNGFTDAVYYDPGGGTAYACFGRTWKQSLVGHCRGL